MSDSRTQHGIIVVFLPRASRFRVKGSNPRPDLLTLYNTGFAVVTKPCEEYNLPNDHNFHALVSWKTEQNLSSYPHYTYTVQR